MEPFNDIECMTLERKYKEYVNSKRNSQLRFVLLGQFTVDIKSRLKFSTNDPDNRKKLHLVIRGQSHHRRRSDLSKNLGLL